MKYSPHPYQRRAIRFLLERACAGLLLDPGLGKTSTTLAAFKILKGEGLVKRALIVAPLRAARSVWPGEGAKWDDFRQLRIEMLHGPEKAKALRAPGADIHVINPEGLPWLFGAVKTWKRWPWEMLVVDESTRFKHTNTQRFKTLKPWLTKFARRVILTGTPAPNGLLDLFGQAFILDLGNALGRYITHYRTTYFDSVGFGGFTWKPKPDAESAIYKRLSPLALRMDAKDHLTLPPLVHNTVKVELPSKAKTVYETMEKVLLAVVEDETVTAANAAAAAQKCRQIANGGLYKEGAGPKEWADVHDAKTDATADLVEELGGKPALIAYEFHHDLARLRKCFGRDTPHLGGGVTAREQARIEAAWNAGELPVLLAQPQSVAHGLNLQGVGAAVIWHSLTWDLENYDQLIRRVWRQGQKERVVVHHVVARGTVDEAILRALSAKDRTQGALLSALKTYAKAKRPPKKAR